MFCPNCGSFVSDETDKFCRSCGYPLAVAPSGATEALPNAVTAGGAEVQGASSASNKKSNKALIVIAVLAVLIAVFAFSEMPSLGSDDAKPKPVEIGMSTFPDEHFREYVEAQFDEDLDGVLSAEELESAREINFHGNEITSLEGIQYFVNLTWFSFTENTYVEEIDLSQSTCLESVEVRGDCDSTVTLPAGMDESNASCSENVTLVVADAPEGASSDGSDDGLFSFDDSVQASASSWIQQYDGTWYADGVPCTMESVRPLSIEGVEPLGVGSSSVLIRDDYVYYVEGSTASLGVASLYREPLGGGSAELLDNELAASDFYLVNDRLYFMAALGEWGEETKAASVSIDGTDFQYHDDVDWIVGASDETDRIFACSYGDDNLRVYEPGMNEYSSMSVPQYSVWGFGEVSDDVLYYVGFSSENSDLRVVFVDSEGNELDTLWVTGGYAAPFFCPNSWRDGSDLYVAGTSCITRIDLDSREVADTIYLDVPYGCEGDASPLFVTDSVVYFAVSMAYDEYADNPVTAGVCRYDCETGESEIVDAWYEQ